MRINWKEEWEDDKISLIGFVVVASLIACMTGLLVIEVVRACIQ